MPIFAYDPRARYLSGPRLRIRRRGLFGLGDDIPTTDSPLPGLTPPDSSTPPLPILTPNYGVINPTPVDTSGSSLPSTLTAPKPAGLPAAIVDSAGNLISTSNLIAPAAPSFASWWNGQSIPGISNALLVAALGGIAALAVIAGGKKKR